MYDPLYEHRSKGLADERLAALFLLKYKTFAAELPEPGPSAK